jgi:hypothetical protein
VVLVAAAAVAVAVVALLAWVLPWLFLLDRLLPAFRFNSKSGYLTRLTKSMKEG